MIASTQPQTTPTAPGMDAIVHTAAMRAIQGVHGWPTYEGTPSLSGRTVLLATDGSVEAAAATRLALAMAEQLHVHVHALTVMDDSAVPVPPPLDIAQGLADPRTSEEVRDAQEEEVVRTIVNVLGRRVEWPVRFAVGNPPQAIAGEAMRLHASLVLVGLRPQGALQRALHVETIRGVMREASCPVLGVNASLGELPTRVMVALDFGRTSLEAAHAARALVPPGGKLVLAYVAPAGMYGPEEGEALVHEMGVQACFDRLEAELSAEDISVDRVVLHRERPMSTARLLLEYAEGAHVELIAAGSVRYGLLDRLLLGSVSTELVRDARCALLVTPSRGSRE